MFDENELIEEEKEAFVDTCLHLIEDGIVYANVGEKQPVVRIDCLFFLRRDLILILNCPLESLLHHRQ